MILCWTLIKCVRGWGGCVCVQNHTELCILLCCQSPSATNQVPGRGQCLIQTEMWHGQDIMSMLRASPGINSCRNAKHALWKAVSVVSSRGLSPPTVRVDHSSTWYRTSPCGMQGFCGPEELCHKWSWQERSRGRMCCDADHGSWKLRLNKASTFVSSPMGKHLLQTRNSSGFSWWCKAPSPHKIAQFFFFPFLSLLLCF